VELPQLFRERWSELHALDESDTSRICRDSAPVLFFGELERALILTVGINPSWREFLSRDERPLSGDARRFAHASDLSRLGAAEFALDRMRLYFRRTPYWTWFGSLRELVRSFDCDFEDGTAAHTDVMSCFATNPTWSHLDTATKSRLGTSGWRTFVEVVWHAPMLKLVIAIGSTTAGAVAAGAALSLHPISTDLDNLPKMKLWSPVLSDAQWQLSAERSIGVLALRPYLRGTPGAPLSYQELQSVPRLWAEARREESAW
jgi:hypothetical protein